MVGNQIFDPALRFEITESTSGKFRGEAGRTSVYHSKVYDSYYSFRWRMKNHFRSHVQPQDPPRSPPLHAGSWLLQSRIWKCYFNFDDWWLSSVFGQASICRGNATTQISYGAVRVSCFGRGLPRVISRFRCFGTLCGTPDPDDLPHGVNQLCGRNHSTCLTFAPCRFSHGRDSEDCF